MHGPMLQFKLITLHTQQKMVHMSILHHYSKTKCKKAGTTNNVQLVKVEHWSLKGAVSHIKLTASETQTNSSHD